MITITIPFKTPTINHLFWHRGNIKILTKEAREIRDKIATLVRQQKPRCFKFNDEKLEVEVEIYEKWHTLKGTVAKKDISNREKFLIDSVFKSLEIDDKFIWKHTMKKIESESEKAIIRISTRNEGNSKGGK